MVRVFVVSDGTGQTAERIVRAALVQFEKASVRLVQRRRVRTPQQIAAVVEEAAAGGAIIVHTLVSSTLRRQILDESRRRGVDVLDMLGPVLERLATHLGAAPSERPGLLNQLDASRQREIDAVNYAFRHDDGQNVEDLGQAEVVLVGVSRTMKTPTTLYLAYRGFFAANVPLVAELDPPPALVAVPPERVFCLYMTPERLLRMRQARADRETIPPCRYATAEHVRAELQYSEKLARRFGWRRVDTTAKSVEEVCREIITLLPPSGPN